MSNLLTALWKRIIDAADRRAIETTRRELIDLDDRTLADIGVSRGLLELGVAGWPWRIEDDQAGHVAPVARVDQSEDVTQPRLAANDALALERAA